MPFSEFEKRLIEREVGGFCKRRVPAEIHDELRLDYTIRGNSVTLLEIRPAWRRPGEWTELKVAQFRRDPETKKWSLYWRDRRERWHLYDDLPPANNLGVLIREVDADPTGIFWG